MVDPLEAAMAASGIVPEVENVQEIFTNVLNFSIPRRERVVSPYNTLQFPYIPNTI